MKFLVRVFVLWVAAVSGQDDKITCSIPPVKPFHDTVLTCNFPEDPSVTKRDFTINHYVKPADPDAVVDCWWLKGNLDCYIQPEFEYNKTVSRQLSVTMRGVKSSQLGTYACQLANYDPWSLETCEFAFSNVTDGKSKCSVPPVTAFKDTVLTCEFPEDLSETKRNFTIYHYVEHSSPDAVLDCWWIRGNLDCFEKQGFRYKKTVSTSLNLTVVSVTSASTGKYACQAAGYGASSLETCELNLFPAQENTCSVSVSSDNPGTSTYLTCLFNEDVEETRRNFTVYKYTGESKIGVVECRWEELGRPICRTEEGYRALDNDVSSYIRVELPTMAQDDLSNYSCWHTGSIPDHQERCSSPPKSVLSHEDTDFKLALRVGLSVGLVVVIVLVTGILLLLRRRNHRRRRKAASEDVEEGQQLMKTKKTPEEITTHFENFLAVELTRKYPNTCDAFYFVPPVYFNKLRYTKHSVAGDFFYAPDLSDPSDVSHDRAMQHVMHCLRHVAEEGQEPMFVLTQFQYEDYLNSPGADYKKHRLPTPAGLKGEDKAVACFDFLIVHRRRGVLVGVVKAVSEEDVRGEDDGHTTYEAVVTQVTEAVTQFRKADRVIRHLLSDHPQVFTVRHTLMLPNLTASSLRNAVASHNRLVQDLRECLGSDPLSDPSEKCLCAEDLSDSSTPWDVRSAVVSNIRQKWKWSDGSNMSDGFYLMILYRFFGLATRSTLQVPDKYERFRLPKTLAEAVSVTGDLYRHPVISPDLLEMLDAPQVLLSGPPDSDKTRMLTLVGKKWMSNGHNVFIVTASNSDRVFSQSLEELTSKSTQSISDPNCGLVFHQECDFTSKASIQNFIQEMIKKNGTKRLCILLDAPHVERENVKLFCEILQNRVPDLYMWVSRFDADVCLPIPRGKLLTRVVNCPPAVMREVPTTNPSKPSQPVGDVVHPSPTDGPPVKHFHHQPSRRFPWFSRSCKCLECGEKVGNFLKNDLFISSTVSQTAESPLKCEDILILFDTEQDITENNFLEGLRRSGIKVQAVKVEKDKVAVADDGDSAWAMNVRHMQTYRTRRKIVVYVEAESGPRDLETKRRALASCTSQLILVGVTNRTP